LIHLIAWTATTLPPSDIMGELVTYYPGFLACFIPTTINVQHFQIVKYIIYIKSNKLLRYFFLGKPICDDMEDIYLFVCQLWLKP